MPGVVVSLGLLLLALIAGWRIVSGDAGPDPAKWLLHQVGFWALILLCATLAISTSRRISGKASLMRWRRPLGLAAFSAASAHVLVYRRCFTDWMWRRSWMTSHAASTSWLVRRPGCCCCPWRSRLRVHHAGNLARAGRLSIARSTSSCRWPLSIRAWRRKPISGRRSFFRRSSPAF